MSTISSPKFWQKLSPLQRNVVMHALFWLAFLVFQLMISSDELPIGFDLISKIVGTAIYAILIYVNIYILIPNFLNGNSVWRYLLYIVLLILIATPIQISSQILLLRRFPHVVNNYVNNFSSLMLLDFIVVSGSTVYSIISDWAQKQREITTLRTTQMQTELNFLKNQINPHFLFNTLNNLYAHTLKKSDQAPEIVLKLSEIMRYMLYECNEKRVLLSREINYLKNYLELERIRQGKHIDISMNVTGEIKDQKIAPLLMITFVENAFKHGLQNRIDLGYVHISIDVDDNDFEFKIANSKDSMLPVANNKSGGIGLKNVKRRLDLMYPNQYNLSIDDRTKEYNVNLILNLNN